MEIITTNNIGRIFYKNKKSIFHKNEKEIIALNDINLNIKQGEIFGVLGPNGAGKTTLIKILTTLLSPTKGKANVLGFDIEKEPNAIRKNINMAAGAERMLYYRLTARENLRFFGELYNVDKKRLKSRIEEILDMTGLLERADDKVETFSKGMKQRLQIGRALINDPKILFLDEPTLGLDPEIAISLRQIIKEMVTENNLTVVLTSNYLQEIEQLCENVLVLNKGRIHYNGEIKDLIKLYSPKKRYKITITEKNKVSFLNIISKYSETIKYQEMQKVTMLNETLIDFDIICDSFVELLEILIILKDNSILINDFNESKITLEDAFIKMLN